MSELPNSPASPPDKLPRSVTDTIFAFPPNRDTLGGTAYLLLEPSGNILIDSPAWNEPHASFLKAQGGVRWLFLSHRGGIGKVKEIQQTFGCEVLLQEQEAYLLPGVTVTSFHQSFQLSSSSEAIWTCGHSPGSACLYSRDSGVLFSGRHLIPDAQAAPYPLRTAKTFHWPRQIQNVQKLIDRFTPETLTTICPGASTGLLRRKRAIENAYEQLAQLDLAACLATQPLL